MDTITVPKAKYKILKEQARAYEEIKRVVAKGGFFDVPSSRKSAEIIEEFKKTNLYNKRFIDSLRRGLARSDFFA